MLKKLGLCFGNNELIKETSFKLADHVTTKERNRTCFLETETTKERIYLKTFPTKSNSTPSFSLSVTCQNYRTYRNGDLAGHVFALPLQLPYHKLLILDSEIPKLFLTTEDIFRDHITMVLSKTCLTSSVKKRLITHILEAIKAKSYRKGFKIEVKIKIEVDHSVNIGCGCKGKEACQRRVVWDRHVDARVTGSDCPICLTELSSEVSRMELWCSHVFHTQCVMNWLKKNNSCPICRVQAPGETYIY